MKGEKEQELKTTNLCRDFMRNVCNRGRSCKFFHPPIEEDKRKYVFCHDFQNGKCNRYNCRFIHCSREYEEHYNYNYNLIRRMAPEMLKTIEITNQPLDVPVRGPNGPFNSPQSATPPNFGNELVHRRFDFDEDSDPKRRCDESENRIPLGHPFPNRDMDFSMPPGPVHQQPYWLLQDEVEMLGKRMAELKKRHEELQAINEFLLEINARLRINEQSPLRSTQQMFMNSGNGNVANKNFTLTKQTMYKICFNKKPFFIQFEYHNIFYVRK
ncbi:zinc finger CCCH domain-containing protein 10-like [Acyrthosiphon pisum]|uniref:C3H1-type domain-containing protein n=1 Tax=Acyrthosiphon pisum TaxID=7029 RepID=A0A8R2JN32_ACYPI|nr:zinc finger CCCH domain-containing protein 10-like [Acyrthosiphon pisum]